MKIKAKHQKVGVRLTDEDGESMEFESVVDAAKFLDVTSAAICQALRTGCRCRGCAVERMLAATGRKCAKA